MAGLAHQLAQAIRGHGLASFAVGCVAAAFLWSLATGVVASQKPEAFRDSVRRNRALLEDLTGTAVVGFRAPSFSITPGQEWAFDVLIEEGYRYDASLFQKDDVLTGLFAHLLEGVPTSRE